MTLFRLRCRLLRYLSIVVPRFVRARFGLWRQRRAFRGELRRRARLVGVAGRPRDGPS